MEDEALGPLVVSYVARKGLPTSSRSRTLGELAGMTHCLGLSEGRIEGQREVDEVRPQGAVLDCGLAGHGCCRRGVVSGEIVKEDR